MGIKIKNILTTVSMNEPINNRNRHQDEFTIFKFYLFVNQNLTPDQHITFYVVNG